LLYILLALQADTVDVLRAANSLSGYILRIYSLQTLTYEYDAHKRACYMVFTRCDRRGDRTV